MVSPMASLENTIKRIMMRLIRIEYCIVVDNDNEGYVGVLVHDGGGPMDEDTYWNTASVKPRSVNHRVPTGRNENGILQGSVEQGNKYRYTHKHASCLQRFTGHRFGHPWTPRVGDLVAVLFLWNSKPLILGNVISDSQLPLVRTPFNPRTQAIDARYDDVFKWCQFRMPDFDRNGDAFNHKVGQHPYCRKIFHKKRDWVQVWDYCTVGDGKCCSDCDRIDKIPTEGPDEHGTTVGNTWLKVYSFDTDDPLVPDRRWHLNQACGSFLLFENTTDKSGAKGWIRLENAENGPSDLQGHLNFEPCGTVDIHAENNTAHEPTAETIGARVRVVSNDDPNDTTIATEMIDLDTGAYIVIFQDGTIGINSPYSITAVAPDITLDGNVHITGTNEIDQFCTHAGCSCDTDDGWCA